MALRCISSYSIQDVDSESDEESGDIALPGHYQPKSWFSQPVAYNYAAHTNPHTIEKMIRKYQERESGKKLTSEEIFQQIAQDLPDVAFYEDDIDVVETIGRMSVMCTKKTAS
jgi:hypothetical protein